MDELIRVAHNIQCNLIGRTQQGFIHFLPRADISLRVSLAEHCNLNCAGCDHFSPLAKPRFADFDEAARDFDRLSKLFEGKMGFIHLEGGEPLLHPDINKFLTMARQKFPKSRINIVTNGLKLAGMPEDFWKACNQNDIVIFPTKYPISANYEAAEQKAKAYNVRFDYFNAGEQIKTLFKLPMDLDGTQDGRRSFFFCHRANNCIYLQNGRLYTCTVAPTARHFDAHFGTHIFDEEANSIDIHKAASAAEILEFLAKPIPFCRYCMIEQTQYGIPWRKSSKDITEWT